MRYIVDIAPERGEKILSVVDKEWDNVEKCSAVMYDSLSGMRQSYVLGCVQPGDCLGVSLNVPYIGNPLAVHGMPITYSCHAMVCNSAKTIAIHRFIGVEFDEREMDFASSDIMVLDGSRRAVIGNKAIILGTLRDIVSISGKDGSVVTKQTDVNGEVKAYNLYDFLIMLCRTTGVNMLAYETVQLFNSRTQDVVTMTLSHDLEAERFFTKMLLDVGRR